MAKDGSTYVNVTYPKYKNCGDVVREIAVAATYGYVHSIKEELFSITKEVREKIKDKYKEKVPEPLTSRFPEKTPKNEAVKCYRKQKAKTAELFPSGK